MNDVVRLGEYRRRATALHFNRSELNQLLGLYASRVIRGEWRDYSIDQGPGCTHFSIYRSSQEEPLFRITKLATEGKARSALARKGRYMVTNRQSRLKQSNSLPEILQVFDRPLRLISS